MRENIFKNFYFIFFFLNWSPIFRISDDLNFGTLTKRSKKLRLSLFSLDIIGTQIFLLSYCFEDRTVNGTNIPKGFSVFYFQRINQFLKEVSQEKYEDLKNSHYYFLKSNDDKNYNSYKETITYKLNDLQEKGNKVFNKVLAYLATIAFVLPLYVSKLLELEFWNGFSFSNLIYGIFTIYIAACFINAIYFIFQFLRIRSFSRFTYDSIKKAVDPEITLINSLYLDYQRKNTSSINEVTFVSNIQKYILSIFVLSLLLLFYFLINPIERSWPKPNSSYLNEEIKNYEIFTLNGSLEADKFLEENLLTIQSIQRDLHEGKIKNILILHKNVSVQENYVLVLNSFKLYNTKEISIESFEDTSDPQNMIFKIIIVKR